ncbi:MAG: DUF4082 domain-containing protein, partial [Gammaproteobacteria bacterium]
AVASSESRLQDSGTMPETARERLGASLRSSARVAGDLHRPRTPENITRLRRFAIGVIKAKGVYSVAQKMRELNNLLGASTVPPTIPDQDPQAVELGMKFSSSVAGTVTGLRFYKSDLNFGPHTGSLWSSTGTRLATVTFNESGVAWQSASFPSPVAITAGATYVISYHANFGHYTASANFFASPVANGPLTAPVGAGVFAYGTASTFPNQTFGAANYWVDVLFTTSTSTVNLPPAANDDGGFVTNQNTALAIPAAALLANDNDPNGDSLTITAVSGASHGTVAFNAPTNTVTFTPTTGYTGPAGFTYTVSDGRGGTASANVSLTVTAPGQAPVSLFPASVTPAITSDPDTAAVELGMKFQVSTAGTVTGIRFYKGTGDSGTHQGHLWSSSGTLLGTATFTGETASGWQTANFPSPIALSANTVYVVSYHSNGHYAATGNFFNADVTNGPLRGLADSASSHNGVYVYGATAAFPTNSYQKTNYWVDVLFVPQGTA